MFLVRVNTCQSNKTLVWSTSTSTSLSSQSLSLSLSLAKVTRVKNFGGISQRSLNTMKDENEDSPVIDIETQGVHTIHDSFWRISTSNCNWFTSLLHLQRFWSHMVGVMMIMSLDDFECNFHPSMSLSNYSITTAAVQHVCNTQLTSSIEHAL